MSRSPFGPLRGSVARPVGLLSAAALATSSALLAVGTVPASGAEEKPAFSGYSSSAWAAPVRLEIYEPTIPIPATPQAEVNFGYSKVEADSGSTLGRASYLWPGDPVGEGAKTILEQSGLPEQIVTPLAAQGYPVQVNSTHPSGPPSERQESFPGVFMQTKAGEGKVSASTGFSNDCDVSEPKPSGGGGAPSVPGLPVPPPGGGIPGLPVLGALTSGSPATGGSPGSSRAAAAEEEAECQIPRELTALVDVAGASSLSGSTANTQEVTATSRAATGDVSLIGGVVVLSGFDAKAVAQSNGKKGVPTAKAHVGTVTIAGTPFSFGPDGYEAAGQSGEIPGLPDEPKEALATLGLKISLPKPQKEVEGDKVTSTVTAAVVEIDTKILAPALQQIPLSTILDAIPFPEDAAPLKSALGAINQLSPRFVLNLGTASATVETVQGIVMPPLPDPDPEPGDGGEGDGDGPGGGDGVGDLDGGTSGTGTPPSASVPGGTTPGDSSGTPSALPPNDPAGAGLPPLFTIPGMLLLAGIAGAAVAGSYLRRLGAAALGGGASCPHGLDSGLPDLRKA